MDPETEYIVVVEALSGYDRTGKPLYIPVIVDAPGIETEIEVTI